MASCWSRERLYEAVWGEPISTLGPKWNVSDAGLKKLAQKPKSQFPDEFTGQSGGPAKRQLKLPFQFDLWG
jgi:hypothetical protein